MTMRPSRGAATGFARDFKDFVVKGNIFDLAVGVIIGGAFGKIVTAFVENIIMPIVSVLIPGGTWRDAKITLGTITKSVPDPKDATKMIQSTVENNILIGQFLGGLLDFVIIAFVIFLMIRALAKVKRKDEKIEAADTRECPYCLSSIPLAATKCSHCTSEVPAAM
jgi:large conductance mechanosensitive channel